MKILACQLQFHTPAFLGDASRSGAWRTPPIKAQLRQWWRVAYSADHRFAVNVKDMRTEEGLLFGYARLDDDKDNKGKPVSACKSEVRIRLSQWDTGTLKTWEPLESVRHEEVGSVRSDLYMGYGPLEKGAPAPSLKGNAAIQAKASAQLSLAFPEHQASRIQRALGLMDHYGAMGGRSRNGWGSFSLTSDLLHATQAAEAQQTVRLWTDCLKEEWPHAIGADAQGRPLIWQTQAYADWKSLMKSLAMIKIGLRTQFKFPHGKSDGQVHDRHWLSYPVTHHSVKAWEGNARLPNSLRFKVRKVADGQYVGVIFHMPCLPNASFKPDRQRIESVWQTVHEHLDHKPAQPLHRIAA